MSDTRINLTELQKTVQAFDPSTFEEVFPFAEFPDPHSLLALIAVAEAANRFCDSSAGQYIKGYNGETADLFATLDRFDFTP